MGLVSKVRSQLLDTTCVLSSPCFSMLPVDQQGKTLQVISLLAALLGKSGTGEDKFKLEGRRRGAEKLKKDMESWDVDASLGLRSFQGKEEHVEREKAKLCLPEMVPILIVVPASVVDNWDYEFSMWGHFRVAVYREERLRSGALDEIRYGAAEILLCGHSLFGSDPEKEHMKAFKQISWKLVVVDEFHGKWKVFLPAMAINAPA